jgi:hypothetical protein
LHRSPAQQGAPGTPHFTHWRGYEVPQARSGVLQVPSLPQQGSPARPQRRQKFITVPPASICAQSVYGSVHLG